MESKKSLYDKFGGEEAVTAVVETFYGLMMADDDVNYFFAETNMKVQKQHQTNFISFVLGGPKAYTGKNMRDAHAHMKLTDKEFNITATHLTSALKTHGVGDDDIAEVMKIVGSVHDDVLNL